MRRESLEVADDQDDLAPVILRERRDDEALILPASDRGDEAFLLQAMQCTAHRRATQAEPLRHRTLGDARTRREVAPHDEAAQLLIDARDRVGSRIGVAEDAHCRGGRRRGRSARGAPRDRGRHDGQAKCVHPTGATARPHATVMRPPIRSTGRSAGRRPFWSTIVVCPARPYVVARAPARPPVAPAMPLDLDDRSRASGPADTDDGADARRIHVPRVPVARRRRRVRPASSGDLGQRVRPRARVAVAHRDEHRRPGHRRVRAER